MVRSRKLVASQPSTPHQSTASAFDLSSSSPINNARVSIKSAPAATSLPSIFGDANSTPLSKDDGFDNLPIARKYSLLVPETTAIYALDAHDNQSTRPVSVNPDSELDAAEDPAVYFEFGPHDDFRAGSRPGHYEVPERPQHSGVDRSSFPFFIWLRGNVPEPTHVSLHPEARTSTESSSSTGGSKRPTNSITSVPSQDVSSLLYDAEVRWNRVRRLLWATIIGLAVVASVSLSGLIWLVVSRTKMSPYELQMNFPELRVRNVVWDPSIKDDPDLIGFLNETKIDKTLEQAFWGVNYTPVKPDEPFCPTQLQVYKDVALLSQITSRLRIESTACFVADYILQAIDDLHLDMHLALGVSLHNDTEALAELSDLRDIVLTHRSANINAVFVGTNALHNGWIDSATLKGYISYIHDFLVRMGLPRIPVGAAEFTPSINALALTDNPASQMDDDPVAVADILNHNDIHIYTNLAGNATMWLCDVVPYLNGDVKWYWTRAISDIDGIFDTKRVLRIPLPYCLRESSVN